MFVTFIYMYSCFNAYIEQKIFLQFASLWLWNMIYTLIADGRKKVQSNFTIYVSHKLYVR